MNGSLEALAARKKWADWEGVGYGEEAMSEEDWRGLFERLASGFASIGSFEAREKRSSSKKLVPSRHSKHEGLEPRGP